MGLMRWEYEVGGAGGGSTISEGEGSEKAGFVECDAATAEYVELMFIASMRRLIVSWCEVAGGPVAVPGRVFAEGVCGREEVDVRTVLVSGSAVRFICCMTDLSWASCS